MCQEDRTGPAGFHLKGLLEWFLYYVHDSRVFFFRYSQEKLKRSTIKRRHGEHNKPTPGNLQTDENTVRKRSVGKENQRTVRFAVFSSF